MADAVPVFAVLSAQRLVSDDRSAGARGPALRAGGVPIAEAAQTRGFLVQYGLPLAEVVPLFAALLSLPLPRTMPL